MFIIIIILYVVNGSRKMTIAVLPALGQFQSKIMGKSNLTQQQPQLDCHGTLDDPITMEEAAACATQSNIEEAKRTQERLIEERNNTQQQQQRDRQAIEECVVSCPILPAPE
jgi:hypothetical protein